MANNAEFWKEVSSTLKEHKSELQGMMDRVDALIEQADEVSSRGGNF